MIVAEKKTAGRDLRFDQIRMVGMLCVILAHVYPPEFLLQLRNFDVPLMVLVSGCVFGLSNSKINYKDYCIKRIIRLVAPTWAFLSIYFTINLITAKMSSVPFPFSARQILSSYFLIHGIGYVWVIRVFILSALTLPFFSFLHQRIRNKTAYLSILSAIYIGYELLFYGLRHVKIPFYIVNAFLCYIVFYLIPFGCVAGFGLLLPTLRKREIRHTLFASFLLFAGLSVALYWKYHHFVPTQNYKYPPRIYYLSYAIFMCFLLFTLINRFFSETKKPSGFFLFFSSSTIWIYLWHIYYLDVWKNNVAQKLPVFLHGFFAQYLFVLFAATLTTYIQKKAITGLISVLHVRPVGKRVLTEIFLK